MTELNSNLNSTMSSDKSSIVVLSNSLDTEMNSFSCSPTVITSIAPSTSNQTNIDCVFESVQSRAISIQQREFNVDCNDASTCCSNSFENDGISVLNTISNDKDVFGVENQVDMLNRRLNEYKRENRDLKEQYDFLTNRVEKLSDSQPNYSQTKSKSKAFLNF
jgi:hypothetical protein